MDWRDALERTWLEFDGRPVDFGTVDCCRFLDAYIGHLTGRRLGDEVRYHSRDQAQRTIDDAGGMVALFDTLAGPHVNPPAAPGDAVVFLIDADGHECAGVMTEYCIVFIHPTAGIARIPPSRVVAAWQLR